MVLKNKAGRCAFGWASAQWGHQEIYAMDPRNEEWIHLVLAAYEMILEQPRHDGVIVHMLMNVSWCPEIISDKEWEAGTQAILSEIRSMADSNDKLVIFNAGRDLSDIDSYAEYMDGYVMENFLGNWGAEYETGLRAAQKEYLIIYAVDTDDTGDYDLQRMRLGLTLSLLNDTTYFSYDFGPAITGRRGGFQNMMHSWGLLSVPIMKRTMHTGGNRERNSYKFPLYLYQYHLRYRVYRCDYGHYTHPFYH